MATYTNLPVASTAIPSGPEAVALLPAAESMPVVGFTVYIEMVELPVLIAYANFGILWAAKVILPDKNNGKDTGLHPGSAGRQAAEKLHFARLTIAIIPEQSKPFILRR